MNSFTLMEVLGSVSSGNYDRHDKRQIRPTDSRCPRDYVTKNEWVQSD